MNSNVPPPFSYYNNSSAQRQVPPQQQPAPTQSQPQQQQNLEQLRLQQQQQQQALLQQQYQQHQFQGQHINPHFIQYQNPQYMAAPLQQHHQLQQPPQPTSPSFYAQQQVDLQNRLAHLQLQHPQQLQRQGRRTPSPTRQGAFPHQQQGSSQSSRVHINRSTAGFSRNTLDRADAVRVKLEHLYKVSVEQAVERNQRYSKILVPNN